VLMIQQAFFGKKLLPSIGVAAQLTLLLAQLATAGPAGTAADQPSGVPQTLLTVRGKSHPWRLPEYAGEQQPTWSTAENAEGFRGGRSPHPAAADLFPSLLTRHARPATIQLCGIPNCCPDWSRYAIFDVMFLQRDNATSGAVITEQDVGGQLQPLSALRRSRTIRKMEPQL